MPKISVIIPVYNVELYIQRCIESVQNQTMKDIEIIVVNDGTPDDSMSIVETIQKEDDRIKIINHDVNMGLMWARKTGYTAASGDYLFFCDSDDYLPDDALEVLYNVAKDKYVDIVCGNMIYISISGEKTICQNALKYGNNRISALKSLLRGEMYHTLWGKLYKRSVFNDKSYITYRHFTNGEDGCLFYQIVDNISNIIQIDKPVYYYVQNIQSSTQVRLKEEGIKSICIFNKIRQDVVIKYSELYEDLKRCITNSLFSLFENGYDLDTQLISYINEYGLNVYMSKSYFLRYCQLRSLIKYPIKRIITRIKYR